MDERSELWQIRSVYGGMNMALDDEQWRPFQTKPASQLAKLLLHWARHVRWAQFRKAVLPFTQTARRIIQILIELSAKLLGSDIIDARSAGSSTGVSRSRPSLKED